MYAVAWLLDADPAIAWQAARDLTDATPSAVAAERARVPHEGLAAGILAAQDLDGAWRRPGAPTWLPTLFTLLLLRATGVDPADPTVDHAISRLETSLQWSDHPEGWNLRPPESGAHPFFQGEEEPCINGGVLALGGYFNRPAQDLARRLLREQLPDGGWNCEAPRSTRSSFHTTICVLEGLLEYERVAGSTTEITEARRRAEHYLLERHLFRRLSTGEPASPQFVDLAFPPRYHYDILRALDYFRQAGTSPVSSMTDALAILRSKQQADGTWPLDAAYDEALSLPAGESVGQPSRWNTLRALRVLRWSSRQPQ